MSEHTCYYLEDDEGWMSVKCSCGWDSVPLPDWETAADCAGDHRVYEALATAAYDAKQASRQAP